MNHNTSKSAPPRTFLQVQLLPVINHVLATYKIWHGYRNDFPKNLRYTLGNKIDATFLNILEHIFTASYQNKDEKLPTVILALKKSDLLKFFLRIAWELHAIDDKKYILLSEKAEDFGRMLGGWKKGLESKTPRI